MLPDNCAHNAPCAGSLPSLVIECRITIFSGLFQRFAALPVSDLPKVVLGRLGLFPGRCVVWTGLFLLIPPRHRLALPWIAPCRIAGSIGYREGQVANNAGTPTNNSHWFIGRAFRLQRALPMRYSGQRLCRRLFETRRLRLPYVTSCQRLPATAPIFACHARTRASMRLRPWRKHFDLHHVRRQASTGLTVAICLQAIRTTRPYLARSRGPPAACPEQFTSSQQN